MDKKERAIELACQAYSELNDAGLTEEFAPLMASISEANKGVFFGSFGGDTGCFIELESTANSFNPIRLKFGIRRYKQSLWSRLSHSIKEMWAILRGHDSEYQIVLQPKDVTKLKDILRQMK